MDLSIDPGKGSTFALEGDRAEGLVSRTCSALVYTKRRVEYLVEQSHPYPTYRWIVGFALLFFFTLRILVLQGWYVVAYALGIYLLSAFLAFLSPKFDPEEDMGNESDLGYPGPALPTRSSDEFKPFIRKLPEFVFWQTTCKAACWSILCTFFSAFDLPVFWPILVLYFVVLLVLTMKRQIRHMIKHNYLPFDIGKKSYG